MKQLLTILLWAAATATYAQDWNQIDSVSFCSQKYKAPTRCEVVKLSSSVGSVIPGASVICGNEITQWVYPDINTLDSAANRMASEISMDATNLKKKQIKVYLLGKEVKGYEVSFEKPVAKVKVCRIVAYGVVNKQDVVVQLTLNNIQEPITNNDLSEFSRQILTLTK